MTALSGAHRSSQSGAHRSSRSAVPTARHAKRHPPLVAPSGPRRFVKPSGAHRLSMAANFTAIGLASPSEVHITRMHFARLSFCNRVLRRCCELRVSAMAHVQAEKRRRFARLVAGVGGISVSSLVAVMDALREDPSIMGRRV